MRQVKYNYRLLTKEIVEDGKVIPFDDIIERLNQLDQLNKEFSVYINHRRSGITHVQQKDMCVRCGNEKREDGALCWKCSINRALN